MKRNILFTLILALLVGCGGASTSSYPPHKYDSYDFKDYKDAFENTAIADENAYSDDDVIKFVEQGEKSSTKLGKLSFVQINDTHGAIYDDGGVVGISHVSSVLNEFEKENGDYIGILGGDIFQGGWLSNITYGEAFVDVLNSMNFNAFVVGNHEFDWGLDIISKYKDGDTSNGELDIPFLGANIYYKGTNTHPSWISPFTIVNSNGYKVGIIGIIGESQYDSISSDKRENYEFKNTDNLIKKYSKLLNDEYDCDSVVLATHDYSQTLNQKYVNLEGVKIDAIFNAHTHELVSEYIERGDGYKVPCVQSNTKNGNVGTIIYNPDDITQEATIKHYNPYNFPLDNNIDQIINKYQDLIDQGNEAVGYTSRYLSKRDLGLKVSEYLVKKYEVIGAFVNQSGVRGDIQTGDITYSKCYNVFPFDNIVYLIRIDGLTAKKVLNNSSNYTYKDPNVTIDINRTYYIATIDFLYIRDSNEFHFKNTKFYNTKTLLRDDFVECCGEYYKKLS